MDNLNALMSLCNAMCNTFYPDRRTVEFVLLNDGINPNAEMEPKDVNIFRVALRLVMGYIEGSRTENGVSTSVMSEDAIKNSILYWCNCYGLDADEELSEYTRVLEDGSNLW